MRNSHLRSPFINKKSKDGQDGLAVRSYFKQSISEFPDLVRPEVITNLDLSFTNIKDFTGMPLMENLVKLNVSGTKLNSFVGAVKSPKLEQISFAGSPIASFEYLNMMCLIAFGPQLTLINHVRVTKQDIKLSELYKDTLEPLLRSGWIVASIGPDIVIVNSSTHKRKRIFMNSEAPIELLTTVMKTPTKKLTSRRLTSSFKCLPGRSPVRAPQTENHQKTKKFFDNENDENEHDRENLPSFSIDEKLTQKKPEAKPSAASQKSESKIAKLQSDLLKRIGKKKEEKPVEEPQKEEKVQTTIIEPHEKAPEVQKQPIQAETSRRKSGIPVSRNSIIRNTKENSNANSNLINPSETKKSRRRNDSSIMETPKASKTPVQISRPEDELQNIPKPIFETEFNPLKASEEFIMDSDLEIETKPVLSIHTTTTPIQNKTRKPVHKNVKPRNNSVKLEMGKIIEFSAVSNEFTASAKQNENCNNNSALPASPIKFSSSISTVAPSVATNFSDSESLIDLEELASPSKLNWPKRRKPRRSIVQNNLLNKSDGSFDVLDLGLPEFNIEI
ncbi:hypothetical protein TVAG_026410 [Trichomonas vaginalis G3]|uniref:Leucine Rich Repeat family protein n=1 Tax=Trichomonas vaginalis (strain ATCC PRA-98 / G3) TaxID=412133 RepID=A2DZ44_TRIV3|nr:ribonuclease inhibitor domain-containing protein [Trichomonas vaginalis G3]EAY14320.1 hypothetical protein TVAG_026410 [Trichomonas vaginalis G3]KAI5517347.1 ribonuclease inhibitor domain-containing protein [Trichomonas vaginalis G3]|eukprot:XP_001326543.1 hypothetical protein [Trichomonas vaginalis G3]